ncbi:MAG TPA: hypothetical protein ENN87_07260 [Phycisphaerales bacterium]|nr:hypothetical protein [Phycisphaerales bacterium]
MDDRLPTTDESSVRPRIRVMQLILSCILAGLVLFLIVALVVQRTGHINPIDPLGLTTLAVVGAIMIAVALVAAAAVRTRLPSLLGKSESLEAALVRYFPLATLVASIAEGGGVLMGVGLLVGGSPALFLPLGGVACLVLVSMIPSLARLEEAYRRGRRDRLEEQQWRRD